jgi:hypothetical protein
MAGTWLDDQESKDRAARATARAWKSESRGHREAKKQHDAAARANARVGFWINERSHRERAEHHARFLT